MRSGAYSLGRQPTGLADGSIEVAIQYAWCERYGDFAMTRDSCDLCPRWRNNRRNTSVCTRMAAHLGIRRRVVRRGSPSAGQSDRSQVVSDDEPLMVEVDGIRLSRDFGRRRSSGSASSTRSAEALQNVSTTATPHTKRLTEPKTQREPELSPGRIHGVAVWRKRDRARLRKSAGVWQRGGPARGGGCLVAKALADPVDEPEKVIAIAAAA